MRKRRYLEQAPYIPEDFKKTSVDFRSPLIYDQIRRSSSILGSSFPEPVRIPLKPGPEEQERSSLIEDWFRAAYRKMGLETFVKGMDSLVATGMFVVKETLKAHEWSAHGLKRDNEGEEDYLERVDTHHRQHFPFAWEHVPTSTYYPLDGSEVLIITRRETLPVLRHYNLSYQNGKMEKATGPVNLSQAPNTVEVIEYWNRTHYVYLVEGMVVRSGRHAYGRPPFFSASLTTAGDADPGTEAISLAFPLLRIQDTLDTLITIQMNWAFLTGFPPFSLEPRSEDAVLPNPNIEIKWGPGKTTLPPLGWKWGPMQMPMVGGDLSQLRDFFKALSDQLSLAPILAGTPPGADFSNAASLTMMAQAKAIFGPGVRSVERMFDETGAFKLRLIAEVLHEKSVPVYYVNGGKDGERPNSWLSIGTETIRGYYEMYHRLEPVIPAERMQKSIWLADAQARGGVSMRYYREEGIGLPAPEKMDEEVLLEQLQTYPEVRSFVIGKAMEMLQAEGFMPQLPGSEAALPAGPGGPGATVVPGVQQPISPSVPIQVAEGRNAESASPPA